MHMNIFKTRTFAWWEIGVIKVCLISLGILLGLYFRDVLAPLEVVWWVLFGVTALYFIVRFVREG